MLSYDEYLQMVQEVNRLRNEVHLFNVEEISEAALDDLKHKITEFELANPDQISPNSPNYVVSGGVAKGFLKYTHNRRMLSLNDIFSYQELEDWEERWEKLITPEKLAHNPEKIDIFGEADYLPDDQKTEPIITDSGQTAKYICEPKIDGLAISLHYEDGVLKVAATRGDGFVGENVTENIKQVRNIPKQISDSRKLEVRGEIFMTKKDFEELNNDILAGRKVGKMGKTGSEGLFANPRNVASGTIRQLDSRIVAERNLSFVAYNIYIEDELA